MRAIGDDPDLSAGQADRIDAKLLHRHRHQGDRFLFAGREQHVHFARRGPAGDLGGQGDQLVGFMTSRTDDHDDLMSRPLRRNSLGGGGFNACGIGDAGAAELLHDDRHVGFVPCLSAVF